MPHYFALQALAIRENTVYIHGTPSFPKSETQIYLDIEGLPDNESYYLIGALVVSEGKESFHSFWADDKSEELARFSEFVESVSQLSDFRILHFGAYDTVAMKRMRARLPEFLHTKVDRILERATNVLSVIHQHIYFPLYSNGLKDIGRFLGFEWTSNNATGLEAIVWRNIWNTAKAADIKTQLLQYNQDDCRALKHVVESIGRLVTSNVHSTSQLPRLARRDWRSAGCAAETHASRQYFDHDEHLRRSLHEREAQSQHVRRAAPAPSRSHQINKDHLVDGLDSYFPKLTGPFRTTIENPNSS